MYEIFRIYPLYKNLLIWDYFTLLLELYWEFYLGTLEWWFFASIAYWFRKFLKLVHNTLLAFSLAHVPAEWGLKCCGMYFHAFYLTIPWPWWDFQSIAIKLAPNVAGTAWGVGGELAHSLGGQIYAWKTAMRRAQGGVKWIHLKVETITRPITREQRLRQMEQMAKTGDHDRPG